MSKRIVLGVTGGIAAYKSAALCSQLMQSGFEVNVIMTENAAKFVAPLTFQTLSRNAVVTSLWDRTDWKPEHVSLADSADLFVVAPATANFIAKYANGIADDALTTFAATFGKKVIIAPAMNPAMWRHPACVENVARLKQRGVVLVGPEKGHVACGEPGEGRMSEPDKIFEAVKEALK
ncbi:MAG: hypothetical protein J6Q80_03530 [Lentisphaeria bacterium]|nr:hypothetical protein [Lentisphaeria bacterium]